MERDSHRELAVSLISETVGALLAIHQPRVTDMKRNTIRQLLRLLGTAGVVLILLVVPTMAWPATLFVDRDHSQPSTPVENENSRISHILKSEEGVPFEKFIRFQVNGESFIYASTLPEGSGAFITEAIFWIAPDGAMHPIVFENAGLAYENQLKEGESTLTGGSGIVFSNNRLRFEFFVASKGDFHCCPTAGKISGTYRVVGEKNFDPESNEYNCTFKLVVDGFKRETVSSDELSQYISGK